MNRKLPSYAVNAASDNLFNWQNGSVYAKIPIFFKFVAEFASRADPGNWIINSSPAIIGCMS